MAQVSQQLPCDGEGVCMVCNKTSKPEETLTCNTCVTPWHAACLNNPPETLSATLHWDCPDCSGDAVPFGGGVGGSGDLIAAIRAIEADESLTAQEKAKKRQQLMSGASASCPDLYDSKTEKKRKTNKESDVLELLDESFKCSFCMQLPDRPVTTPCGHNFCLKCFEKWINQGNRTCVTCRGSISQKIASHPRINSALVVAIRMAKISKSITSGGPSKVYHFYHNQNRPDKAFTTERAKKAGKANACSGKIFVTVPPDHFGPILAENDPTRNQGVLVGECWEDRMECRQWGAHMPHVAGIAGQGEYGAQSVALSGGYLDDEDHGEWFLYTGSGGRDLTGNKRTNKNQSFDQTFDKSNEALRVSCKKGYPVRVVRSYKEKRSSYAPETGVRYDGVYRIEKCWRKVGVQGFKVCRYLFVRCDNEPAPWTSDEHGDQPRPLPKIPELKKATDITARTEEPSWDYDEEENVWKWKKPSPASKKSVDTANPEGRRTARAANRRSQNLSVREKLLKEFICSICRKVMTLPLTTPCAHNFCKHCLEGVFAGKSFVRERGGGNRSLRAQKIVMKCPTCKNDISDFLKDPKVNREMMGMIESLQRKKAEEEQNAEVLETEDNYEVEEDEENAEVEETEENAEVEDEDVENEVVEDSESEDPPKRRKVDSMDGKESEREGMKPVSVSGEIEHTEVDTKEANTPLQKSMDEVEDVLDSLSKISDDGKGDDGNESPSSPLHLC